MCELPSCIAINERWKISYKHPQSIKGKGIYIDTTFIENVPILFELLANKHTDKHPFLI